MFAKNWRIRIYGIHVLQLESLGLHASANFCSRYHCVIHVRCLNKIYINLSAVAHHEITSCHQIRKIGSQLDANLHCYASKFVKHFRCFVFGVLCVRGYFSSNVWWAKKTNKYQPKRKFRNL
eukprot:PhF_6_TR26345/c0_g1_i1/m.37908